MSPTSAHWMMLVAVGLAGCNLYDHGAVTDARDTPDTRDGPEIDAFRIPATITIGGVASARSGSGAQPVAGITVTAYQASDLSTALETTTTGSDGSYAFAIATHEAVVHVVLETSSPSYVATYNDVPPLVSDAPAVPLDMFTPAAYAQAYSTTGVQRAAGSAMLEIQVYGVGEGISFTSSSGTVEYTSGDLVGSGATSTGLDGVGFVLDANAGSNDITAYSQEYNVFDDFPVQGVGDALVMATLQVQPPVGGD